MQSEKGLGLKLDFDEASQKLLQIIEQSLNKIIFRNPINIQ